MALEPEGLGSFHLSSSCPGLSPCSGPDLCQAVGPRGIHSFCPQRAGSLVGKQPWKPLSSTQHEPASRTRGLTAVAWGILQGSQGKRPQNWSCGVQPCTE